MALRNSVDQFHPRNAQGPLGLDGLCGALNRSAQLQLEEVSRAMARLAPKPGALVHLQTHRLAIHMNGFEPVVFSAIDASTLLQVAQVYLTTTTAAAVTFVDFVAQCFPFRITHIRTKEENPFVTTGESESRRDFSEIMRQHGLVHSVTAAPSQDSLFALTSKLTFGGISEGSMSSSSETEVQTALAHFLFFHNNYRSVPWLGGKTPVQKLGTFEGIKRMDSFDPYASYLSGQLRL